MNIKNNQYQKSNKQISRLPPPLFIYPYTLIHISIIYAYCSFDASSWTVDNNNFNEQLEIEIRIALDEDRNTL